MEYRDWISKYLKINEEFLYLSRADVASLNLTDDEIVEYTKESMIAYSTKNAEMPAKIGIHPLKDTLMHAMPANMTTHMTSAMTLVSSARFVALLLFI